MNLLKILNLLLEFVYLGVIFFVPLCFAVFLKNNSVFELNKIIIFKILVLLFLIFSLLKFIYLLLREEIEFNFSYLKIFILPLGVLFSFALATFFSLDFNLSFYGLYNRFHGFNSFFYYPLFFVLLIFSLNSWEKINRLLGVVVASSFFVCCYGLVQIIGIDPLSWNEPALLTRRISSTLGQPNFLAAYLLLVIPLGFFLFVKQKKLFLKIILGIILLMQLACLFFTGSRSAWLGFLLSLLLAFLYFLIKNIFLSGFEIKKLGRILFYFSLSAIIVLIVFLFNDNFKNRILGSFDFEHGSVAVRLSHWPAGLQAIKERPFLGYGPETQSHIFALAYEKDWAVHEKVNAYPNRAHNLLIDILLAQGFFGLFIYLALTFYVLVIIFSNIKKNKQKFLQQLILFALSSYFIALLFGFSVIVTSVYLWMLLAIIFSLYLLNIDTCREGLKNNFFNTNLIKIKKKSHKFLLLLFLLLVIIFSFRAINYQGKYLLADFYFYEFYKASLSNNHGAAFMFFEDVVNLEVKEDYYLANMALLSATWLGDDEIKNFLAKKIIKKAVADLEYSEYNYKKLSDLARVYGAMAFFEKDIYKQEAENIFKKIINSSPFMPSTFRDYAVFLQAMDRNEEAIVNYQKSLSLLPDLNDERINEQHQESIRLEKYFIYKNLGDINFELENYKASLAYYREAYKNDLRQIHIIRKIAESYYQAGEIDKAIWYNLIAYKREPKNYIWPMSLAVLFHEQNDFLKYYEYRDITLSLIKNNDKIKEIFTELDKGVVLR